MKPEELDQLFRKKLEGLEEVPGVAWNHDSAWKKIATKLHGGWNLLATVLILAGTLGLILYFLPPAHFPEKALRNSSFEKPAAAVDTFVLKVSPAAPITDKSQKQKIKNKKTPSPLPASTTKLTLDTLRPVSPDTLLSKTIPDTLEKKPASTLLLKRFQLRNSDLARPPFDFSLPKTEFLKMKISNSFNFKNLIQSVKAQQNGGENLYYNYEYNNNRSPLKNIGLKYTNSNTIHLTNINRQK